MNVQLTSTCATSVGFTGTPIAETYQIFAMKLTDIRMDQAAYDDLLFTK